MLLGVVAAGVDPEDAAVARVAPDGQLSGRRAEEAGRVPPVPSQAQAAPRRAEGQAGDQLQHASDQAPPLQPTRLHAHRGQDGLGKIPFPPPPRLIS